MEKEIELMEKEIIKMKERTDKIVEYILELQEKASSIEKRMSLLENKVKELENEIAKLWHTMPKNEEKDGDEGEEGVLTKCMNCGKDLGLNDMKYEIIEKHIWTGYPDHFTERDRYDELTEIRCKFCNTVIWSAKEGNCPYANDLFEEDLEEVVRDTLLNRGGEE